MIMFLESPWPAALLGGIALALLGVAYHHTRDRRLPLAMLGALVLTLLLLALEWWVTTDREAISLTLEDVAVALEANDIDRVLAFIAPEADEMRADALNYLPGVEISDANVGGDLQVAVNRFTSPRTARATFTGRITGVRRQPSERGPYDTFVRKFTLKLREDQQGWLITGYDMDGVR